MYSLLATLPLLAAPLLQAAPAEGDAPAERWYRGNTHTHTLWSDGDAAPEHAVKWYVDNGYHFLVLSDHNVMQQGETWFAVTPDGRLTPSKVEGLETDFGTEWVRTREGEGGTEMRLRTLEELKARFETPEGFLLVPGEEITDRYRLAEVHINAINIERNIDPTHGDSVQATIQNNLDAIRDQAAATGRPAIGHVNHPNYRKSMGVTNLALLTGDAFFEVYNGHRGSESEGDENRPDTEVMWDRALARRLGAGAGDGGLLYGVASDDAHDHYEPDAVSVPGRGWIMVRATELEGGALVEAMKRGDFYASTGVELTSIDFDGERLSIGIRQEPGVTHVTEFIGTRRGDEETEAGRVLATTDANPAVHVLDGDELYVRARVVSSRLHPRPYLEGDRETAWVQPVRPAGSAAETSDEQDD